MDDQKLLLNNVRFHLQRLLKQQARLENKMADVKINILAVQSALMKLEKGESK